MRFLKSLLAMTLLSSSVLLTTAQNCKLVVPPNPLTATGLSTPYRLQALTVADTCDQLATDTAAFVQGVILDLDNGTISIYNPLVINDGATALSAPIVPVLPTHSVVGLWFGFNGATLTLAANGNSLTQGKCVNGITGSIFGQFSYCNAPAFFESARNLIQLGKLIVPPIGTASDGLPCPTTRDFMVVDQDQSDNVLTSYMIDLVTNQIAQDTQANRLAAGNPSTSANGSDNRLLDIFMLPALGCKAWKVPDLADNNNLLAALPLNEIQAEYFQASPQALVPVGDPMVLDANGNPSLTKTNLYRAGVFQPQVNNLVEAPTASYCTRMVGTMGAQRIFNNRAALRKVASPMAGMNLYDFLQTRMIAAIGADNLVCSATTLAAFNAITWNATDPVTTTTTTTTGTAVTAMNVGIGVGVAIGGSILIGGAYFLVKKQRVGQSNTNYQNSFYNN